ncbi:MAG: hypothetical protein ACRYGI_07100 [Janthinobacterium lividum]
MSVAEIFVVDRALNEAQNSVEITADPFAFKFPQQLGTCGGKLSQLDHKCTIREGQRTLAAVASLASWSEVFVAGGVEARWKSQTPFNRYQVVTGRRFGDEVIDLHRPVVDNSSQQKHACPHARQSASRNACVNRWSATAPLPGAAAIRPVLIVAAAAFPPADVH